MQTETKKTPTLRFPEFNEDWENKKLGKIAKFTKGKGISKIDIDENGKFECIRYGELYTHYKETIEQIKSKTNLLEKDLVFSESNDVIIPSSGETHIDIATASCVLKDGIALGGDLNILKTKMDGVFLAYYLNNKKKYDVASFAQGSSVIHLYSKGLKLLSLNIPKLLEQEKIASFLTSIDKKIEQLTEKKDLLEKYKKGVMQKIFNQEIRFKDENGEDFADWEVKKLGEVCKINPKSNQLPDSFIYIDLESVENGMLIKENRIKLSNAPSRAQRLLTENDILYQTVRPYQKNNLFFNLKGSYVASTGYAQLRTKNVARFLFQYLHTQNFVNKVLVRCTGTSYPAINSTDLSNIPVKLPEFSEQKIIADFLSAIDDKINLVNQELEKMQEYKKGLLQKMFV